MRVRFAPSPTGHLHVGNARTALFNWLLARRHEGRFILRIEDTDVERSTRESEAGILDDLRWLGLTWDEGPDVGGTHGPYRQSERLATYREHAERLLARRQAYYCFCSPEQLEQDRRDAIAAGEQPTYRGRCRSLHPDESAARVTCGTAAAIRFLVPPGDDVVFHDRVRGEVRFSRHVIGDPVIVRSDGHPSYNFAVVVDDSLMEVTEVIRGEDHVSNTPRQVLLYEALGYPPPRFAHLSMVLGPDHTPLSKRHGATSVAEFRSRGYLPEALVNYLALIGWSPGHDDEILPLEELARRFAIEDVGKSAGVFDPEKLAWMNRHYMRVADPARLARLFEPHLARAGLCGSLDEMGRAFVATRLVPIIAGAVNRLEEGVVRVRFVFEYNPRGVLADPVVSREFADEAARQVAFVLAEELSDAARLADRATFRELASRVGQRAGQKGRALFHPIRVVLTGQVDGPELDLAVPAIDTGAGLPPSAGLAAIPGCRERAEMFVAALNP